MNGLAGPIRGGSDFLGLYDSVVWGTAQLVAGDGLGGVGFTSVNEGSFASTVDEPGGILAVTSDTGDDDNAFLTLGKFCPADGGVVMEARFKYSNVDCAIFVGFQETIDKSTPVMGAEFATATMTYNAVGNVVGFNYDVDGTTDDFRAVAGDGGAAVAGSGMGTRAMATLTADRWFTARVSIAPDGTAECYLSDSGHVDTNGIPQLRLIKRFSGTNAALGTTGLNPADSVFAVLAIENRSAAARVLEVDYLFAEGNRDWRTT